MPDREFELLLWISSELFASFAHSKVAHPRTMLTGLAVGLLQMDDQGLVNTDPRTIAVPDYYINMIPTDVRGLTFSRTPQQVGQQERV